jgi:cytochrome c oxidase cbb3-type subunit 3
MPANRLSDDEIWQIITYLRKEQQPPSPSSGEASRGEKLFFEGGRCSRCHMVNGNGGRLGPELSQVGSARSLAYLVESIRDPDRQLSDHRMTTAYDRVTAVTADGKTIVGLAMNEDTFTVQIMDLSERIHSLQKRALKSLLHESKSLMPAFGITVLGESDLQDLVAYLRSLRAPTPAPEKGSQHVAQ